MTTFADPLRHALQTGADRVAIAFQDRRVTFRELWSRCGRLAGALRDMGLERGDRVAILAANSDRYIEAYLAIPAAGFAIVPLNTRHAEPELRYALEDAGAKVLLTDRDPGGLAGLVETVVSIPDDFDAAIESASEAVLGAGVTEEDLAGLFYTGGTTGASKGVMLTHRNLIANTFHFMNVAPHDEDTATLIMAPLFHAAGSNGVLAGVWSGSLQVPLAVFDPADALDLIAEHRITMTLGVPAMIAAISELQHAALRDVSSVLLVAHGGSPIATEVVRRASAAFTGAEFLHVYGATETAPLVTGLRHEQRCLDEPRGRSCGRPLIGVQLRIVNEEGETTRTGEVGEVAAAGPNIMKGYWNKPEQTDEVLRDGWYHTGDLGRMDEDGYLYLVDRAKDMIVSGGENIYCSEVEEALYRHPAVLEAAAFGVPDDKWGEAVHAVVVKREEVSAEELIEFCREYIAGYKLPKAITFSDTELPKSGPGKVLKRKLREPFWEGHDRAIN